MGVREGCDERINAATPAESGQENDVPFEVPNPLTFEELATYTLTPIAQISGFMRPSAVGPEELKLAITPD